jgi:hypothetical protein
LNEVLGAFDFAGDGLEVERGLGWIAVGDAVDAVLADEDECVSKGVEGNGKAAAGCAHHEFVLFDFVAAVVKNGHFLSDWKELIHRKDRKERKGFGGLCGGCDG